MKYDASLNIPGDDPRMEDASRDWLPYVNHMLYQASLQRMSEEELLADTKRFSWGGFQADWQDEFDRRFLLRPAQSVKVNDALLVRPCNQSP